MKSFGLRRTAAALVLISAAWNDSNRKLEGYEYSELASLVRYRHRPGNPALARVLARDRDIHLTLDVRLQMRAREILANHLRDAGNLKGALVVMEASTGRVLALVSVPAPEPPGTRAAAPCAR